MDLTDALDRWLRADRERTRESRPAGDPPQYERFETVTVRAAARVLRLRSEGVIPTGDAWFYLHELAAMDRHAGPNGLSRLARPARRRPAPPPIVPARRGAGPNRTPSSTR